MQGKTLDIQQRIESGLNLVIFSGNNSGDASIHLYRGLKPLGLL
jgi:hypothetical protein